MRTLRFQLVAWFAIFFVLLATVFIIGTNVAVQLSTSNASIPADSSIPKPTATIVATNVATSQPLNQPTTQVILSNLHEYSIIGTSILIILAVLGAYLLSGIILRPLRLVSNAAAQISQDNLQERINYNGADVDIKSLADTFNNMMKRLQLAFESKGQFIQDASHELKTPIATAKTNIQVLKMKPNPNSEDYKRVLSVVELSLDRMNAVSEDLLILSDNGLSKSSWAKINLASLVNEAHTETEATALANGIIFKLGSLPSDINVQGDSSRLKQAIINLIDNAIKYNRRGGEVEILIRGENTQAIIEVKDTGIGIAPSDLSRVFERFYRVDKSRSREQGGSGLGLAIVKKIVEDHDGTVYAQSVLNEGSVFTIVLPRLP